MQEAVQDVASAASLPAEQPPETVAAVEVAPEPPRPVIPASVIARILAPPPPRPAPPVRPKDKYAALKFDIDAERRELAQRRSYGERVDEAIHAAMNKRLTEIIETWKGTRWSYSGTTQVPRQGKIACGYFVSTVLEHAGFDVDRVELARSASEQIVRTVVPDPEIERLSRVSRDYVADRVLAQGDGVYIVGLDTHVGFLINPPGPGKDVKFCHSTRRYRRAGVICEDARSSPSLKSRYTVLGKLGAPMLVQAWLEGDELPTARKNEPQVVMALAADPLPNLELMPPVAPAVLASVW
ncbi:MAG: hypothetical protein R3F59_25060 [Myxococcota bacterium]